MEDLIVTHTNPHPVDHPLEPQEPVELMELVDQVQVTQELLLVEHQEPLLLQDPPEPPEFQELLLQDPPEPLELLQEPLQEESKPLEFLQEPLGLLEPQPLLLEELPPQPLEPQELFCQETLFKSPQLDHQSLENSQDMLKPTVLHMSDTKSIELSQNSKEELDTLMSQKLREE